MKFEALLLSAFLTRPADAFAPLPLSSRVGRELAHTCDARFGDEASKSWSFEPHRAAGLHGQRRAGRKRPRSWATQPAASASNPPDDTYVIGGDEAKLDARATSSAATGAVQAPPLPLPRRLQDTVDRLDRQPDIKTKSKLLVELGDAFALTEVATLSRRSSGGDDSDCNGIVWHSRRVPGCVSEVSVAVSVLGDTSSPGGLEACGGATVSIRGTADARLSRGMLALLAVGLDGEKADAVLRLRGKTLANAVGLRAGLTDSRINGLGNMLGVIQELVREHLDRSAVAKVADATAHAADGEHVDLSGSGRVMDAASSRTQALSVGDVDQGARTWGPDASSWFPLPGAEDEVAMLLSGGVDSSVAMRLLQDEGYRIRAFYLKIWLEDELSHLGECPWQEDLAYASAVCEQAGVPLEVVPLQREYWDQVVSYTVREAREGRTPNPDVMCNSRIKFGMFYDHVGKHFRHVATGHYARLEHDESALRAAAATELTDDGEGSSSGGDDDNTNLVMFDSLDGDILSEGGGRVRLLVSPDAVKDQTYFLCALNQAQLGKALFPVGAYTKERIRELAESYDLPTKNRKDSQGICFLGKLKFDDFLRHYLGEAPGTVVDRETGQAIGEHRGLWFHTIGQRKGVGPGLHAGYVNLGPWYVSGKDMATNVLEVTNDREAIDGPRESFQVEALRWIAGHPPPDLEREGVMNFQVKTRHGPTVKNCVVRLRAEADDDSPSDDGADSIGSSSSRVPVHEGTSQDTTAISAPGSRAYVRLETKESAIAPGQFAAFYLGDECVGSGVISDSTVSKDGAAEGGIHASGQGSQLAPDGRLLERPVAAESTLKPNVIVA